MWVIFDHLRPSGHIMPDHVGDRGAARLDLGASRSPTYQPWVIPVLLVNKADIYFFLIVSAGITVAVFRSVIALRLSVAPGSDAVLT
jgi:hypothetical protein